MSMKIFTFYLVVYTKLTNKRKKKKKIVNNKKDGFVFLNDFFKNSTGRLPSHYSFFSILLSIPIRIEIFVL